MNKFFLFKFFSLAVIGILVWGSIVSVQAVSVVPSTASPTVTVGSVFLVDVNMNTEGQTINVVDGYIELSSKSNAYQVNEVLLGGSVFDLWPEKPSVTKKGNTTDIKFVGGSERGINSAKALLMRIAVSAVSADSLEVNPKDLRAFVHDGSGTKTEVGISSLSVRIIPATAEDDPQNALQDIIAQDNTSPEPFVIELGRDQALFDGKYFLSFFAIDKESGIAYYEVKEGERGLVRSGSPYVLIDQDLKTKVTVIAYDKAGNTRIVEWKPKLSNFWSMLLGKVIVILGALVILAILVIVPWFAQKLWRKRKQNKLS